jgi:hypothetical protein
VKNRFPKDAIENGFALLTEERRATGIFGGLDIKFNSVISALEKYSMLGVVNNRKCEEATEWVIKNLRVKTPDGKTKIRFEAGKDFSFNASEYTEEELAGKRHNFELEKCEDNVICIDYRMAGVGSNSCGPELNEKYRVPIPKLEAQFKIVLQ